MFRTQELVPEVYPDQSRDFQVFCRIYDVVFNSVKRSIDSMQNTSSTQRCDSRLLPLLKTKLGLFSTLELNDVELRQILTAFPHIVRYKGSFRSIEYIVNLYARLFAASGENVTIRPSNSDYVIEVFSETPIQKTDILVELLKYIIPAGYRLDYYKTILVNVDQGFPGKSVVHSSMTKSGDFVSRIVIKGENNDVELLQGTLNIAEICAGVKSNDNS